ncbi:hypothetical protein VNO77_42276 [Canavalia gladiata]|uniref:Uncharacterized protein n=1 Tax=Canavalia gladiata TaxID=3824 RepID=A0AAN9K2D9_CANGL
MVSSTSDIIFLNVDDITNSEMTSFKELIKDSTSDSICGCAVAISIEGLCSAVLCADVYFDSSVVLTLRHCVLALKLLRL